MTKGTPRSSAGDSECRPGGGGMFLFIESPGHTVLLTVAAELPAHRPRG